MKWSSSHIYTLKESPSDAEIPSHKLLVRGGFIKKLGPGLYTYGVMALRSIKKFEAIVREELERAGCLEVLMPIVQPREIWEETNRWTEMGAGLLKFRNRNGHDFCLGATHEEAITDYVRHDVKSYRDLPVTIFQIQTKYRDEIRPRFGLMRGREFIMKDAYSFDLTEQAASLSYDRMYKAYQRIFDRLGLDYRIVQADSGNIGGNKSHEFHVLADSGEDQLMVEEGGDFAANIEVCPVRAPEYALTSNEILEMEEFETKGLKKIKTLSQALNVEEKDLVKTMFYAISEEGERLEAIAILLRGCDEANPVKIKNSLGLVNPPRALSEEEVHQISGAWPGSCGPVGLKIPVYMDHAVSNFKNMIVGANRDGFHLKNVNRGRDFNVAGEGDFCQAKDGDIGPNGRPLRSYRGIEVGHVFYLGTKYSKSMNATYLNQDGQAQIIEMGCYGIGISRSIQSAVEQSHDQDGIKWPVSIAPFVVHICHLDPSEKEVDDVAQAIYSQLHSLKIDCFMDDREERPGVKFKDADLLGMPLRLTIGGRGVKNGQVEISERQSQKKHNVNIADAVDFVQNWLKDQ